MLRNDATNTSASDAYDLSCINKAKIIKKASKKYIKYVNREIWRKMKVGSTELTTDCDDIPLYCLRLCDRAVIVYFEMLDVVVVHYRKLGYLVHRTYKDIHIDWMQCQFSQ